MKIEKIVIVGGGTAGWLSATYLEQALSLRGAGRPEIVLVESPDIGIIGVGEATVPNICKTLAYLELDEDEFMWSTNASFKQAIRFRNWRLPPGQAPDESFFHPFEYPEPIGDAEFWSLWANYRARGGDAPLDYAASPQPAMCDALKVPKTSESTPFLGSVVYAYHLDAVLFGRFLREKAIERGVRRIEDTVNNVNVGESGRVLSLDTAEHGAIEADFFVDCTGFRGLLINQTLDEPFVPFGDTLLCDRAVAMQTPHPADQEGINPFTTSLAMPSGWIWNIQLFDRAGNGYVYSSAFISDDEAEAEFRRYLGPAADGREARRLKMRVGRNRRSWVGNCAAIGLSSGFVEPLESTGIYLIERALELLVDNFPDEPMDAAKAGSFNAALVGEFNDIVDFITLHYCLTEREDTAFWRANKFDLNIPDSLSGRLQAWRDGLPSDIREECERSLFKCASWNYILAGLRFRPDRAPPLPDGLDEDAVDALIGRRLANRERILPFMLDHKAYLELLHDDEADHEADYEAAV